MSRELWADEERVVSVEVVELRPDIWEVVVIGNKGTRRSSSNRYNTEEDALRSGKYRIGLVMR